MPDGHRWTTPWTTDGQAVGLPTRSPTALPTLRARVDQEHHSNRAWGSRGPWLESKQGPLWDPVMLSACGLGFCPGATGVPACRAIHPRGALRIPGTTQAALIHPSALRSPGRSRRLPSPLTNHPSSSPFFLSLLGQLWGWRQDLATSPSQEQEQPSGQASSVKGRSPPVSVACGSIPRQRFPSSLDCAFPAGGRLPSAACSHPLPLQGQQ